MRVSLLILALLPFCVTARSAVQSGVSDSTGFAPQVYMVGYAHFDTQWRWSSAAVYRRIPSESDVSELQIV